MENTEKEKAAAAWVEDYAQETTMKEVIDDMVSCAREEMAAMQSIAPKAVLVIRKNPETGETLDVPGFIFITPDESLPFNSEYKAVLMEKIKAKAKELSAIVYFFLCEAWMVKSPEYVSPSTHPDREEMFTIFFEHWKLGCRIYMAPILEKDNKRSFGEMEFHQQQKAEGTFTKILPHFNSN